MAPTDLEQLERMLAEERPQPDPAAARRIDERVRRARQRRVNGRLPAMPSLRGLSAAGAMATLLVGLAVGIAQLDDAAIELGSEQRAEPEGRALDSAGSGAGAPDEGPPPAGEAGDRLAVPEAAGALADPGAAIYPEPPRRGGGLAAGQEERIVERNAMIRLSGDPGEVRGMADEVIAITDRVGGIVVSASVNEVPDEPSRSRANLEVAVPVAELDRALAEISEVGSVEAREQTDLDVTAGVVSAGNRLRNARETRNALRERLERVTDADEIEDLRRQIERAERRVAARKAEVQRLASRTQFARIHVSVVANGHGDDGSWSLGDAWDDAIEVLRTMAGVALITAAVALPIALLSTLVYLLTARTRRRARERALGEDH